CAAALAGCGQGEDARSLEDKERARLRQQALDWLRADLDWLGQRLEKEAGNIRPVGFPRVQHWLRHPRLAVCAGRGRRRNCPSPNARRGESYGATSEPCAPRRAGTINSAQRNRQKTRKSGR